MIHRKHKLWHLYEIHNSSKSETWVNPNAIHVRQEGFLARRTTKEVQHLCKFSLHFSLLSDQIDDLLISKTKTCLTAVVSN